MNAETGGPRVVPMVLAELNSKWSLLAGHTGWLHYVIDTGYCVWQWTLTDTLADGSRVEVNGCDFLTVRGGQITRKDAYRKQRLAFHPTP